MNGGYILLLIPAILCFVLFVSFPRAEKRREKAIADVVANPELVTQVILKDGGDPIYCYFKLSDGRSHYFATGSAGVRIHDAWHRGDQKTVLRYLCGERSVFERAAVA